MTLSKLARLANVSVSTVSKAFSGSRDINENTREMIFEVARNNNCFVEFFKSKYPKYVVAAVCPEYESRYYTGYLSALRRSLENYNADMCVSVTGFDSSKEIEIIEYYSKYAKADGIIVVGGVSCGMQNCEIPLVSIASKHYERVNSVDSDFCKGIFKMAQSMREAGHTKIGYIGEPKTASKLDTFESALSHLDLELDKRFVSVTEERFEKGGYMAMKQLFETDSVPTAVFAAYDYMAIGAVRCIQEMGLSVPGDISVCGADNIPECEFLFPSLSSIGQNTDKLCMLAVNLIMDELRGNVAAEKTRLYVEPTLFKRESMSICKDVKQ